MTAAGSKRKVYCFHAETHERDGEPIHMGIGIVENGREVGRAWARGETGIADLKEAMAVKPHATWLDKVRRECRQGFELIWVERTEEHPELVAVLRRYAERQKRFDRIRKAHELRGRKPSKNPRVAAKPQMVDLDEGEDPIRVAPPLRRGDLLWVAVCDHALNGAHSLNGEPIEARHAISTCVECGSITYFNGEGAPRRVLDGDVRVSDFGLIEGNRFLVNFWAATQCAASLAIVRRAKMGVPHSG